MHRYRSTTHLGKKNKLAGGMDLFGVHRTCMHENMNTHHICWALAKDEFPKHKSVRSSMQQKTTNALQRNARFVDPSHEMVLSVICATPLAYARICTPVNGSSGASRATGTR